MSRRFDAELLDALPGHGLRPEVHQWVVPPEDFHQKELMARVELAPALLFGARRLLMQMAAWLAARDSGVSAFTLRWADDRRPQAGVGRRSG
jgi:protein ImuB